MLITDAKKQYLFIIEHKWQENYSLNQILTNFQPIENQISDK